MAVLDIVERTKLILYGTGLGEKPALRVVASNANESVSGELVTFTLASGEGAKVKPGNILAVRSASNENQTFIVYVTSVSTDTVTGVNGYLGSASITGSDSGDMDDKVLEQNPLVTTYEIFEAIDQVIAHMLYPYVYIVDHGTISSPDLIDGQHEVPATVKEILFAQQKIGDTIYKVPAQLTPHEVHTTLSSTGKLAEFDWIDGSTGYYTYKRPITEDDDDNEEITLLIATGAAAVALGAAVPETSLSVTKKDNVQASDRRGQAADRLWRDFLTLRQNFQHELQLLNPQRILIDRG